MLQRYKPNTYVQNEATIANDGIYFYYVRPFVPFWCYQSMKFEEINNSQCIPPKRGHEIYKKRGVFHNVVKTWKSNYPSDKNWFDRPDVFSLVKKYLIARLNSESIGYSTSSSMYFFMTFVYAIPICNLFFRQILGTTVCGIVEFGRNIDTIIDCWLLYQMKAFAEPDHPLTLNYFPSWNSSKDVSIQRIYDLITFKH